jgi:hypothetical protein
VLALQYAQLKLQFTCTLLQRLDQGGQVLNLQILIVFKCVQLLLQSDHFFLKRLFLLVGLGGGRFFGATFNGTDHLLMLPVGFLELALRVG